MQSENSCEKLVALEEGTISSDNLNRLPIFGKFRSNTNSRTPTNCLLGFLGVALILLLSYGIWQEIQSEELMKRIETQNFEIEVSKLPLRKDDTRIMDLTEEFEKLRNTLNEMQKRLEEKESIPVPSESPTTISSQEIIEDISSELVSNRSKIFPMETFEPASSDSVSISVEPTEASASIFHSTYRFRFGGESEEKDSATSESEDTNETDSTQSENASSEGDWRFYFPEIISKPFTDSWSWAWSNSDEEEVEKLSESEEEPEKSESKSQEEYDENSESDEILEKLLTSDEKQTDKSNADEISYKFPTYDDYESYYDDYSDDISADIDGVTTEHSPTDLDGDLHFPTTLPSLTPTENKDAEDIDESTFSPILFDSTFGKNDADSEDFFGVGSPVEYPYLELGLTPSSKDVESGVPTSTPAEFLAPNTTVSYLAMIDKYVTDYLAKRISDVEYMDLWIKLYEKSLENDEDLNIMLLRGFDEFEKARRAEQTPSSSSSDEWSYISKRSVETPAEFEMPVGMISPKEMERKMDILRQAIDDDNHFIQNEVSLAPEPTKQKLQKKLNNFYTKMEALSAHIDRLHERYLRLNKLDDDYVSRELSPEDNS